VSPGLLSSPQGKQDETKSQKTKIRRTVDNADDDDNDAAAYLRT
jgi:hypothetical protein